MMTAPFNHALFADTLLSENGTLTDFLGCMIAHAGYGLVLATADRRIVYANDAAKAVMRASHGLQCMNNCISATEFNASRQLQSLISAAARKTNKSTQGGSLILRNEDGAALLAVHVVPLSGRTSEFSPLAGNNAAGLLIFDCQRGISDRVKVFSELFALTPAETRVLSQLVSGGGVAQAAQQLKVAPSTAQTHLKRILEKTGTHRQAELVKVFYEISIPWYGRGPAKPGRPAPWQAPWLPTAAEEATVQSRSHAGKRSSPSSARGAQAVRAGA